MQITEAELLDYLDDRLPPAKRAQVEAYLARHPDLRDDLERMRVHMQALRAVDTPAPPQGFAARVFARLDQEASQRRRFEAHAQLLRLLLGGLIAYAFLLAGSAGLLLFADIPLIQPFTTLLRILAHALVQVLELLITLVRALVGQPLVWAALLLAVGVVAGWGRLISRVLSASASSAKP